MPGIQIVGAGNNQSARVNPEGRLKVISVSDSAEYHANWEHETAFFLQTSLTVGSSATFLYIKNTDDNPMILENLFVTTDTDDEIYVYRNPSGTPTGGTTITPSNSNFGSNKSASGVFQYGDLGGLTNSELYNSLPIFSGENNTFTFRNWIILPKNASISFYMETGGNEVDISMPFFYLPGEL